ncbi:DUF3060 domain-containing protein [Streptomyces sp. NPDC001617]
MRIQTLLPAALITLTLSATVGCSVNLSQPAKNEPTRTKTPTAAAGTSTSRSPSADSSDSNGSSSPSTDTALKVSGTGVTQTIDCAGRDVVIDGGTNTLVFKGDCGTVTLNGSGNTVGVESVDTMKVKGQANTVYLKTVGTIDTAQTTGSTVGWVAGADGGSPKMSGGGNLNTVEQISEQEYESDIS